MKELKAKFNSYGLHAAGCAMLTVKDYQDRII